MSTERPFPEVLALSIAADFTPERPSRPPWHQPSGQPVQIASTGNVAVVNLKHADRVQLRNLAARSDWRDELEFFDWTPAGWGGSST